MALAASLLIALASLGLIELAGDRGLVPHLALAPIFLASVSEERRIGPVGAFLVGLLVDVLTLAPLGLCAAAYVAFHGIAASEAGALRDFPPAARLAVYVPLAGAVVAVHVVAMIIMGSAPPSPAELLVSLVLTVLAYPAVAAFGLLAGRRRPEGRRMIRG